MGGNLVNDSRRYLLGNGGILRGEIRTARWPGDGGFYGTEQSGLG